MLSFTFDWPMVLTLLSGTVLPLVVGLVTTRDTNSSRKAIILAALAVLIPLCSELANALTTQTPYDVGLAIMTALGTFLIAVGMHYGLWKPVGASEAAQRAFTDGRHEADPLG